MVELTLEQIEIQAQERLQKLALTEELLQPHDHLPLYKRLLKISRCHLQNLHRQGTGGLDICRAYTHIVDHLLVHLCQAVKNLYQAETSERIPTFALIALGGYGRRELNPYSDIDLMFLHTGTLVQDENPHPFMQLLSEQFLYTLYDIPFKVGCSVRTLDQCVEIANQDMVAKTSLIETRRIVGSASLYKEFQKRVLQECIKHHERQYIEDRQKDQRQRHERYGNSVTMLEPNLKNGCGGLRDFHNLIWLAWFKHRTWNLDELRKKGDLSPRELSQLRKAHDFLLRVRNEIHFLTNRDTDTLTKAIQPTVATHLGYTDKSPAARIEKFMQALYTHTRNIHIISRTLEQRLAAHSDVEMSPALTSLAHKDAYTIDGFKVADGWIRAPRKTIFKRDPGRILRLFLLAQQRGLHIHPDLVHTLGEVGYLNADNLRRDPRLCDTFLQILHQRGSVAPVLRLMHETGLLGDYLPEFDKLTCLVQHEFFHRYTADEHTLVCIQQLDAVWQAQTDPHKQFKDIFKQIESPHILYLALLLHDIGKAVHDSKNDHATISFQLTKEIANRLGLSDSDTELLLFLVKNHLYLWNIATRQDIYAPKTIASVANSVDTPERLKLLLLLSFADTMGTGPEMWNGYKELLIWTLYSQTMKLLEGEPETNETVRQHNRLLRKVVQSAPRQLNIAAVETHLNLLSDRYRRIFTPQQIAKHILAIQSLSKPRQTSVRNPYPADSVFVPVCKITWERLLHQGCSRVTVCAYHQRGLFNKICGSLTATGLTIANAQIFVRQDGIALNTFHVLNVDDSDLPSEKRRVEFEKNLEGTLCDALNLEDLLNKRYQHKPSFIHDDHQQFSIPTEISFDLRSYAKYTNVHIQAVDHVGLLYLLTRVLLQLGTDIVASYNLTEKGVALDQFLITDCMGNKITSKQRLDAIEKNLRLAIEAMNNFNRN